MIINPDAYRRMEAREADEALRRMTVEDSIAIGEAILTSELMQLAAFTDDDRPQSLAIALGIQAHALRGLEHGSERV